MSVNRILFVVPPKVEDNKRNTVDTLCVYSNIRIISFNDLQRRSFIHHYVANNVFYTLLECNRLKMSKVTYECRNGNEIVTAILLYFGAQKENGFVLIVVTVV